MKYLYICLLSILVVLSLQSCKRGMSPNDYNELVVNLHESSWQYFQDKSSEVPTNTICLTGSVCSSEITRDEITVLLRLSMVSS